MVFALWQTALPGWVDEPHEKIVYVVILAIVTYIGNQLRYRHAYMKELRKGAEALSNPHADRTVNGPKLNSGTLLNYAIEDIRELRGKQEDMARKLEQLATKDDVGRLDVELRELRKRMDLR